MNIKHVIFDMDGTLVDSEFCAAQSIVDVIPDLRLSVDSIVDNYRGMKLLHIFSQLQEQYGIQLDGNIVEQYRERETFLSQSLISLYPGVKELLACLDCCYCIASNAPTLKTVRSLRSCGIYEYFANRVYSAYDVNAWKPAPELFLHAVRSEGYSRTETCVLEDSDAGIEAAKAAAMIPVLFNPQRRKTVHDDVRSISNIGELSKLVI